MMKSSLIFVVLLFVVTPVMVQAEVHKSLTFDPTVKHKTSPLFSSCYGYIEDGGWIGLRATIRVDSSTKVYHNLMLMPAMDTMVLFDQHWTIVYDNGKPPTNDPLLFTQEDFFWEYCGDIVAHSSRTLAAFRGWHGLPLSPITAKK
jgi:hypothetical protein